MTSPQTLKREQRRQAILVAAARVFSRQGYQRATVDQIAEAAGIAKGSIYLYYKSKEDLFHALFESFTQKLIAQRKPQAATDRLKAVEGRILEIARAVGQDDLFIPLTLEFWSVCGVEQTRERFGRSYAEVFSGFLDELTELLEAAKANGEIKADTPSAAIASCLIAMLDGLLIQQWTVPGANVFSTLEKALPVFLRSLRQDS